MSRRCGYIVVNLNGVGVHSESFTVDDYPTFGRRSGNRNIAAVNRAIGNCPTSTGRTSKELVGCRRVIDNCCNRDAAAACRCSDVDNANSAAANAVD